MVLEKAIIYVAPFFTIANLVVLHMQLLPELLKLRVMDSSILN